MTVNGWGGIGAVLLLSAVATAHPATSYAYTPEQQQACTDDALRLCSSEVPDVDRITACMVRHKAELSPSCRAQFGPEPGETATSATGKPMSIRPVVKKPAGKRTQGKRSAKSEAS
ncbi:MULTISPECIES: hypothetical protein [unclassified Bradyrhizobium]|uniref:hypothetical protein n=1 Tax=unclassified Bradyrhizobium TaxID=2631580 RepID=UPI0028E82817|nr:MULTISPECIES: hypothetical protein [unclassified Bradyrhizobium]